MRASPSPEAAIVQGCSIDLHTACMHACMHYIACHNMGTIMDNITQHCMHYCFFFVAAYNYPLTFLMVSFRCIYFSVTLVFFHVYIAAVTCSCCFVFLLFTNLVLVFFCRIYCPLVLLFLEFFWENEAQADLWKLSFGKDNLHNTISVIISIIVVIP